MKSLVDYFHKNYYPDLDRSEIEAYFADSENNLAKGVSYVNDKHGTDYSVEEIIVANDNPRKPLVNWFSREKEFEYSNPTDKNGNAILNPKTGRPLEKTVKNVTVPDSILGGSGFKKTVTKEEYVEKTPSKIVKANIPVPTLAPIALSTAYLFNQEKFPNAPSFLPLASLLGGMGGSIALWELFGGNKSLIKSFDQKPDNFAEGLSKGVLNGLTLNTKVVPVREKISKGKSDVKTKRTVEKESDDTSSKLTPRFL